MWTEKIECTFTWVWLGKVTYKWCNGVHDVKKGMESTMWDVAPQSKIHVLVSTLESEELAEKTILMEKNYEKVSQVPNENHFDEFATMRLVTKSEKMSTEVNNL